MDPNIENIQKLVHEELGTGFEINETDVGRAHATYHLNSKEKSYFLKTSKNDTRFQVEGPVIEHLNSKTDVKLPRIVDFDNTKSDYPFMYMLTQKVRGENLNLWDSSGGRSFPFLSVENKKKILFSVGRELGKLHSQTSTQNFGFLESKNNQLEIKQKSSWPEIFKEIIIEQQTENFPERFSQLKPEVKEFVSNNIGKISECNKGSIIHQDYRWPNILVDKSSVSAVLDWERALYGDPEYDLAKAEESLLQFKTEEKRKIYRESLFDGYREERTFSKNWEEKRAFYRALRPVEALWTFDGWTKGMDDNKKDRMASENKEKLRQRISELN